MDLVGAQDPGVRCRTHNEAAAWRSVTKKDEPFDAHEGETHEINIRELELACADGPVQARVWDARFLTPTKAIGGMEEVGRRFPAKWFEIKKWLGGMKDSYINYNTYAARHHRAAPRLAGPRNLRHPAGKRHTPRKAARSRGRGSSRRTARSNLQRRGKAGDAERKRLPAGEVGLCAEYKNLSVVEQMEWDGDWVPRAALEKQGIIPADEIAEVAALKLSEEEKSA
jgi:hypothetical protein